MLRRIQVFLRTKDQEFLVLLCLAVWAVAFWLNFSQVLRYEVNNSIRIPFDSVPQSGALLCPESYDSHWLGIMRYTQCKGLDFKGRQTKMKEPTP